MPYLSETAYRERFGAEELEHALATDAALSFDRAAADAQAIVDSYLAAVSDRAYAVPLVGTTPPRILEITADLARYELHSKKVTHEMKRRRNEAIAFLEALVAGTVAVPELLRDGGAVAATSGLEVFAEPRVFTTDSLRGYLG